MKNKIQNLVLKNTVLFFVLVAFLGLKPERVVAAEHNHETISEHVFAKNFDSIKIEPGDYKQIQSKNRLVCVRSAFVVGVENCHLKKK